MGHHERRAIEARHKASLTRYRREAEGVLRTYLVAPDDAALDAVPILRRATRRWLDKLPRSGSCTCIVRWIPDKSEPERAAITPALLIRHWLSTLRNLPGVSDLP